MCSAYWLLIFLKKSFPSHCLIWFENCFEMAFGKKMIDKWKSISGRSFPDKKRVEEATSSTSLGASHRAKLDMGRLKETATAKKKELLNTEVQNSLKQEILQLEKRLQDQFEVRRALEQALGYRTSSHGDTSKLLMPKPATELIKEIAVLELEVVYLEQYLLSLYRKAFDQQISSVSPTKDERLKSPLATPRGRLLKD